MVDNTKVLIPNNKRPEACEDTQHTHTEVTTLKLTYLLHVGRHFISFLFVAYLRWDFSLFYCQKDKETLGRSE